jgi:TfoX/Sxy family transcriptional regulator of competence genes
MIGRGLGERSAQLAVSRTRSTNPMTLRVAHIYNLAVAYDDELADRIRELLGRESGVTEKKMFGGLAFLIGGNMAIAASGQGGVLVRVDPAKSDKLVAKTNARLMEMRGRKMQGWLRVDSNDVRTKRELAKWVELSATFARTLPAKK